MRYRVIGPQAVRVSAVGYGCPTFRGRLSADDEKRAIAVVQRAIEIGVTYIDTADHNAGNNEEILAKALKGRREKAILATKVGNLRGQPWSGGRSVDGRPDYIRSACEQSLRRLGSDYIDILYLHRVDPAVPIEETVGAMKDLVVSGKARHIGLSEAGPETLRRAAAVHPVTALESEFSLLTRDYEDDAIPACRRLGVGFVAYYPLGRGLLTGSVRGAESLANDDSRRRAPRFQGENLVRNRNLVEGMTEIAREKNCTPAQLALAWILAQGDFFIPIPGASRIEHVEANAAAADIVLGQDELARLDCLFHHGAAAGARHEIDRSKELNI